MRGIGAIGLVALALGSAPALAADSGLFLASLAAGAAGSYDDDDGEFGHSALQAGFGVLTDERTYTLVRVGRLSLDDGLVASGLDDAELEYVNVAGEMRMRQAAYDFGLSLGVGAYRLEGTRNGQRDRQTDLGVVLGFLGEFDLNRRFSIVAEADVHYALFDEARLYGVALVGVAVHF